MDTRRGTCLLVMHNVSRCLDPKTQKRDTHTRIPYIIVRYHDFRKNHIMCLGKVL